MEDNIAIAYCAFAPEYMDVRVKQLVDVMRMAGARVSYCEKRIALPVIGLDDAVKILVIQRILPVQEKWIEAIRSVIAAGWLVVHEYDDYPKTPLSVKKNEWQRSMGWQTFEMCHGVQTSTEALADVFRPLNANVRVFKNHLFQMPKLRSRRQEKVRVFFGAFNREQSWRPIIKALNDVLNKNPEVEVVTVHDRPFFDSLETDKKKFHDRLDYDKYLRVLSGCDIALLPLADNQFNRYKSDIKFVEAAAAGAAVIASPTVYEETIIHGENGLIANSADQWASHLALLIDNKAERDRLRGNASDYVVQNRLMIHRADERLYWYRDLWSRRKELNTALFAKFPDLA